MSNETFTFTIDGVEVEATKGQTIMKAADAAGIYIPRLCAMEGLSPIGSCRLCTVMVDGRPQAACIQPAAPGSVVDNDTPALNKIRRDIVEMMLVEGNHFCMFCEKSGNCELQAMAYRLGIMAPKYRYFFKKAKVDASHPDIMIDRNRCIHCGRCVVASREIDGKSIFEFVHRGAEHAIAVSAEGRLDETALSKTDKAADVCPVGAIIVKRVGYAIPIGKRQFDHEPIGSDIESGAGQQVRKQPCPSQK